MADFNQAAQEALAIVDRTVEDPAMSRSEIVFFLAGMLGAIGERLDAFARSRMRRVFSRSSGGSPRRKRALK